MLLQLVPLAADYVSGIYTVGGKPGRMPDRMRYLHPDAAIDYSKIQPWVVVSDMFRTPESSLEAVRAKRGAQPPAYSAHNFGKAIDLALKESMERLAAKLGRTRVTKAELDATMEKAGWFCHRRDHLMEFEAWHYNHLGIGAKPQGTRTSDEIEACIQSLYGAAFKLTPSAAQSALRKLRFYGAAIDGDIGPLTRQAIRAFQRAWGIGESGMLDAKTQRTLAYVSADKDLVIEAPRAA
jgi:hypothetical protein